jgi:hypothetical protein
MTELIPSSSTGGDAALCRRVCYYCLRLSCCSRRQPLPNRSAEVAESAAVAVQSAAEYRSVGISAAPTAVRRSPRLAARRLVRSRRRRCLARSRKVATALPLCPRQAHRGRGQPSNKRQIVRCQLPVRLWLASIRAAIIQILTGTAGPCPAPTSHTHSRPRDASTTRA